MQKKTKPAPPGFRWVRKMEVWHVGKKAYIRRRDGLPFVFLVRCK
jgi:hypothetical protein